MAVLPCGRHVPKLGNLHQHVQTSRERQGASICAQARVCAQRRGTGIRCPCAAISNGIFLAVLCVNGSPPLTFRNRLTVASSCTTWSEKIAGPSTRSCSGWHGKTTMTTVMYRTTTLKCPVSMCSMCRCKRNERSQKVEEQWPLQVGLSFERFTMEETLS